MPKPIVVVGAGLAGLATARRLCRAGQSVVLLEATDRPGGRLKTDVVDGFTLDHGFQVLFEAYPAARTELRYPELAFRAFAPGAFIRHEGRMHRVDRSDPFGTALDDLIPLADKLRVLDFTRDCLGMSYRQLWRVEDVPTSRYLRHLGFSVEFLERFARPFFGGIFLDRSLNVSSRIFTYYWRMLAEGRTVVPARGIAEIPRQMVADLPAGVLRLESRVRRIEGSFRAHAVVLESGETIEADAIVVATEADTAAKLTGFSTVDGKISQVCLYFEAPMPPVDTPHIVLTAEAGLTNMVVPMSVVAKEYAPEGRHLVSATILGDREEDDRTLAMMVKAEVESWFPGKRVDQWHLLKAYRIPFCQFPQPAGNAASLPGPTPGRNGLYFAGEFTQYSSIDGALASASVADLVVQDLAGVRA